MKSKAFFRKEFYSDFKAMAQALEEAVQALARHECISAETEPSTRLCLEEALVNAIRHGNQCDPSRKVSISLALEGEACHMRVCDEGQGFQPEQVKLPDTEQLGGRGICLIRHYMDHVHFNKAENCLEMTLLRKRPKGVAKHG